VGFKGFESAVNLNYLFYENSYADQTEIGGADIGGADKAFELTGSNINPGFDLWYHKHHGETISNRGINAAAFSNARIAKIYVGGNTNPGVLSFEDYDYDIPVGTASNPAPFNQSFFGSARPNVTDAVNVIYSQSSPCFVAGTMINTDQGILPIQEVTTSNTIRNIPISRVTKCGASNLVLVKKHAFGKNRPNKDTLSTHWHGIYLKDSDKDFVRLKDLVNDETIIPQYDTFSYVYNIGLKDTHSYMYANNLKVETIIPSLKL
jgi:hypothetical protein